MKSKQNKTLKNRILLSMLTIVILQTAILIIVFGAADTKNQLALSSVHLFKDSVDAKSKEIVKQMVNWSNIKELEESVALKAETLEKNNKLPAKSALADKSLRQQFLKDISDDVLSSLRKTETNGCFIILDSDDSESKDAIYLRDLNPKDRSESNKDILVIAGSSKLMFDKGYTLDGGWTSKLTILPEDFFYQKPFKAGNTFTEINASNLGYWSLPFRLRDTDLEIITYTQPLLDSNHECYGIIGVDITLDYLNKFLSSNTISIGETNGYYLGTTPNYKNFTTVLVSDSYYKARLHSSQTLKISHRPDKNNLWLTNIDKSIDNQHIFAYSTIKLYNTNTPFEGERWVVGGLITKDSLYEASHRFELALLIACAIASSIAIIGSAILTTGMLKPITGLMNNISLMEPSHVQLSQTNIKEFDDLAKTIEALSDKVYKAGSRVADILEISNLPLGICEYEEDSNTVFCTHKFLEITEIYIENWNNNYIAKSDFTPIAAALKDSLSKVPDEIDIYSYAAPDGTKKWLNLKTIETGNLKDTLIIILDVTHDIEEKMKIIHDRDYDVLTGLYNRRAFTKMVSELLADKTCTSGVLSIWDLDNLKYFNDTYGHDMGDKYICLLAQVLTAYSCTNMITARMSGDEFMVFLYNDPLESMYQKLEKIHEAFIKTELSLPDGTNLPVSVSAGMVSINESNNFKELSRFADFAMYEIKKKEKGGIKRFNKESHMQDYILVQGVGELNRILKEKNIRYAYQPIIDLHTKTVFGYEALMRPNSDMLQSPVDFLRVAESQSKLYQVEVLTWFLSLAQFRELNRNRSDRKLFVNSIPNQILSTDKLLLLSQQFYDMFPYIVMEITENTLLNTQHEAIKTEYRNMWNMQYALDDYGTGYSNTDMLVSGNFDYVKLDRNLIHDINHFSDRKKLVSGMIQYCHGKNIKVIAEGIETLEELTECILLGADYGQGFYFAKPAFTLQEPLLLFP